MNMYEELADFKETATKNATTPQEKSQYDERLRRRRQLFKKAVRFMKVKKKILS